MAFLSYEQVEADDTVKSASSLTIPAGATYVMIQADTAAVRCSLDGSTHPSQGIRLIPGLVPEAVLIQDVKNIQFTREGGDTGNLNLHYGN